METGRAAAIAAGKQSFDLCDDSEGPGVAQVLSDPHYLARFGYGPLVDVPEPPKVPENGAAETKGASDALASGPLAVQSVETTVA